MTRRQGTTRAQKALYQHIIKRDHQQCQLKYPEICQGKATTADHIIPHSKGGPTTIYNLQAACKPCNQHKSNSDNPQTNNTQWQ